MQKFRIKFRLRFFTFFALSFALFLISPAQAKPWPRPKLVLLLVIDQFRSDYLIRLENQFLPKKQKNGEIGGFGYLLAESAYFPFAKYDLLQSVTAAGHTTIVTGSYPYQAGIPLNAWYNSQTGRRENCMEDAKSPLVGVDSPADSGRSPKNLIGTTVGDELKNSSPKSKVISISLKDRSAILMGGHRADLALWFDQDARGWVTSRYYAPDLPGWVQKINLKLQQTEFKKSPKVIDIEAAPRPLGIDMTVSMVQEALRAYSLGKGPQTDFLAVSFSTHDFVGHQQGPHSKEIEEVTLLEDRAISKILNSIQQTIPGGLANTLVLLTGDHGVAPTAEWSKQNHLEGGTILRKTQKEILTHHLNERFGKLKDGASWIADSTSLNFYIHPEAIASKKLERKEVEEEIRKVLRIQPEIASVITRSDILEKKFPIGMIERQALHSYYPSRSGDVIAIPKPFFIAEGPNPGTTEHMTGYSYDRTVPLLFLGPSIRPGIYSSAEMIDLAPTLAFLLGVLPPALSEGRVLSEAVNLK